MVTERLTIGFTPAEGAVLRMLGLVERRGYVVRGISMRQSSDSASLSLEVEPRDKGRRLEVVAQQLGRLIDVNSVSLATGNAGSPE